MITITMLKILEITVARATPITPMSNIKRKTALKIIFIIFEMMVAYNGSFVKPNDLKYPANTGVTAMRIHPPPTISIYSVASFASASEIPILFRISPEKKNKNTESKTPIMILNIRPICLACLATPL